MICHSSEETDDCILWCQCASAEFTEEYWCASYGLQNGWQNYVNNNIRPITKWYEQKHGKKLRILLHLPFGRSNSQQLMHAYGYLEARQAGKEFLYRDFGNEIKKLTDEGHEVIAYLGSPHNTNRYKDSSPDLRVRDMWLAYQLPIQAGCSLAMDNVFGINRPEYSRQWYWLLKAQGIKMYGEATPEKEDRDYERLRKEPAIIIRKLFLNRHVGNQHPGARGRFELSGDLPAEKIVLFVHDDGPTTGMTLKNVRQVKKVGGTPALTIAQFKKIIAGE